jgi:hypothetical protein
LDSSAVDEQIAKFFRDSSEEYLTSRASAAFSRELAGKAGANIVGHTIEIGSNIDAVCSEVKSLIEVCELILHKGEEVTPDSIQAAWPEYDRLCREGEKLTATIEAQFGRRISVGRVLVGEYFRLKRPYILGRIRHLERLLNDEEFRAQEFERRRDSR